jgi:hypothetical protein
LRVLILLLAAIAVWTTCEINRRRIGALETKIAATRPLVRELVIDDPDRAAVMKLEQAWDDDEEMEVYLPDGQYRLCVATRGIGDTGLSSPTKIMKLGAGQHLIALNVLEETSNWRVTVRTDLHGKMVIDEPRAWGSRGSRTVFVKDGPSDMNQPLVLIRKNFTRPVMRTGGFTSFEAVPEGILLWIEKEGLSSSHRQANRR